MEDSNVTVLGLVGCLVSHISDAINSGLTQDDVNTALSAVQQLVGQVGPSEQKKTGIQPGTAPRK